MSMYPNQNAGTLDYGSEGTAANVRLRFFHMVYVWMAVGLALTGVVSYLVATQFQQLLITSPWIALVAGLGAFALAWFTQSVALRISAAAGTALFLAYAGLIGVAIAGIWIVYGGSTIGVAFGLTAGIFAIMSGIGFITKMDLSRLGSVLGMIVLGLFAASLVNIFFASNGLSWIITYAIVIVFPILVAVETQQLKEFADQAGHDPVLAPRMAIVGSLILYISFINIFLAVLRIIGDRD